MDYKNLIKGKNSSSFVQFFRYFFVGILATAVDMGILFGLTEIFDVHYQGSAVVGFIFGWIVSYVFSVIWVFDKRKVDKKRFEFIVFGIIGALGLWFNYLILDYFTEGVGIYYGYSKVIAVGVVFIWNFVARKVVLF